jgi:hypothetical protein
MKFKMAPSFDDFEKGFAMELTFKKEQICSHEVAE